MTRKVSGRLLSGGVGSLYVRSWRWIAIASYSASRVGRSASIARRKAMTSSDSDDHERGAPRSSRTASAAASLDPSTARVGVVVDATSRSSGVRRYRGTHQDAYAIGSATVRTVPVPGTRRTTRRDRRRVGVGGPADAARAPPYPPPQPYRPPPPGRTHRTGRGGRCGDGRRRRRRRRPTRRGAPEALAQAPQQRDNGAADVEIGGERTRATRPRRTARRGCATKRPPPPPSPAPASGSTYGDDLRYLRRCINSRRAPRRASSPATANAPRARRARRRASWPQRPEPRSVADLASRSVASSPTVLGRATCPSRMCAYMHRAKRVSRRAAPGCLSAARSESSEKEMTPRTHSDAHVTSESRSPDWKRAPYPTAAPARSTRFAAAPPPPPSRRYSRCRARARGAPCSARRRRGPAPRRTTAGRMSSPRRPRGGAPPRAPPLGSPPRSASCGRIHRGAAAASAPRRRKRLPAELRGEDLACSSPRGPSAAPPRRRRLRRRRSATRRPPRRPPVPEEAAVGGSATTACSSARRPCRRRRRRPPRRRRR